MSSKKGKVQEAIDEKLLGDRKVFLWGMVDDDSAKHVIDRLMYLDMENNKEIQLFINSPGGYVTSGFAIYDTINALKSPVSTICTGLAASMGSILLSVGKKGTGNKKADAVTGVRFLNLVAIGGLEPPTSAL